MTFESGPVGYDLVFQRLVRSTVFPGLAGGASALSHSATLYRVPTTAVLRRHPKLPDRASPAGKDPSRLQELALCIPGFNLNWPGQSIRRCLIPPTRTIAQS